MTRQPELRLVLCPCCWEEQGLAEGEGKGEGREQKDVFLCLGDAGNHPPPSPVHL